MNRKIIIVMISVIFCIVLGTFIAVSVNQNHKNRDEISSKTYNGLPISEESAMWMYNTSTPEKAIGAHQYVFVAKVNRILRTEYKNSRKIKTGLFEKQVISDPYTIYSITVIQNIKGELITSEEIEYRQYGGISEEGDSYTFFEGVRLLNENEYYILMAGTSKVDDNILTGANPNGRIALGDEENFKLKGREVIEQYKQAYENEYKYNISEKISKYDVNYNKQ